MICYQRALNRANVVLVAILVLVSIQFMVPIRVQRNVQALKEIFPDFRAPWDSFGN